MGLLKKLLALKNSITNSDSFVEFKIRELFANHIKDYYAEELYHLIEDLDDKVIFLDFERVNVIDIGFFRKLKELSGKKYSKIKYVNLSDVFKPYI